MPQGWPKARVTFADPCSVQFSSLHAKGLQHYFPEAFSSSFFATPCQVMLLLAECCLLFYQLGGANMCQCHYVPVPLCASATLLGMETSPLKCRRWKNQAVLTSNIFVVNVHPKAFSCVGRGILKNHEVSKIDLALYVCILCPQGSGSKVVGC